MLFVLSPAKNLNEQDPAPISTHTQPELLAEAEQLMAELKRLAPQDIATLMHVSDKIALLNGHIDPIQCLKARLPLPVDFGDAA